MNEIQLEIFEDWWWWSGYRPFSRNEERVINSPECEWGSSNSIEWCYFDDWGDPSDGIPFPLVKPSIDIFGVPRRSRKQRGWYHVRSPSLSRQATVLDDAPPQTRQSGADVPAEIISAIAEKLAYEIRGSGGVSARSGRHEIVQCASVCRWWAKILQPILLNKLCIRSESDMLQLQSFFDASPQRFSRWTLRVVMCRI